MKHLSLRKQLSILALCFILVGCASCGETASQKNHEIIGEQESMEKEQEKVEDKEKEGELGNSNTNLVNGGLVAKKDGWIYFVFDNNGLYMCKEDLSEKKKLYAIESNELLAKINVVDEYIYFLKLSYSDAGVFKIKTDGTDFQRLLADNVTSWRDLCVIDDTIYYNGQYSLKTDGTGKRSIYKKSGSPGYTFNIVNGWIYFFDDDVIKKMKTDGSDLQTIFDGRADHMIVDGDWIYFQNHKDNHYLYKMRTDGSDVECLLDKWIMGLSVADEWIYYNDKKHDGTNRIKIDGTDDRQICTEEMKYFYIIDDWIYYIIDKDNTIYRMKTDGSEQQTFFSSEDAAQVRDISSQIEPSKNSM